MILTHLVTRVPLAEGGDVAYIAQTAIAAGVEVSGGTTWEGPGKRDEG